jgi:hypothetical protein
MEPHETLYLRWLQADYKFYQERITTLVSSIAAITVEKIRRYNEDGYYQPGYDEYDQY